MKIVEQLIPEASLAGPPDAPNATLQQVAFSLEKTVSERLRDDGLGALKEVDSCIEMVKAGKRFWYDGEVASLLARPRRSI